MQIIVLCMWFHLWCLFYDFVVVVVVVVVVPQLIPFGAS